MENIYFFIFKYLKNNKGGIKGKKISAYIRKKFKNKIPQNVT